MRTEIGGENTCWSKVRKESSLARLMLGFLESGTLMCKSGRKLYTLSMFIRPKDRINSCCLVAWRAAVPILAGSKCSKKCVPESNKVILKSFYEMVVVFTCSVVQVGLENCLLV